MYLLVQLVTVSILCGVLWFVQLVHYPLLAAVPASARSTYMTRHLRAARMLLASVIAVDASGAVVLALTGAAPLAVSTANLALLLVALGSTWLVQQPQYVRLVQGDDVVNSLCAANWVRTGSWTARAMLLMGTAVSPLQMFV